MKKLIALCLLLLAPIMAHAQSVQQSGTVTPGHAAQWVTNGVVKDAAESDRNGYYNSEEQENACRPNKHQSPKATGCAY